MKNQLVNDANREVESSAMTTSTPPTRGITTSRSVTSTVSTSNSSTSRKRTSSARLDTQFASLPDSNKSSQSSPSSSLISSSSFRSSCFNVFLVLVVSILTNSVFYRFYYHTPPSNSPTTSTSTPRPSLDRDRVSLLTWQSGSDLEIKSYDHVAFAPVGHYDTPSSSGTGSSESSHSSDSLSSNHLPVDSLITFNTFNQDDTTLNDDRKPKVVDKRHESNMAVNVAQTFASEGKYNKASRIFKYALRLDPLNTDALTAYAEFLEHHKKDIVRAEHFYSKAIYIEPSNDKALLSLKRAAPLVTKIDRQMFGQLDGLLKRFYDIPSSNAALRRAKREAYFMHIYHSNAIEGNTLNLQQTRHIVENRMTVGGKSVLEHNEVLGLDAAMRFINQSLLYRPFGEFTVNDIQEIHRRVLGFCDPIESGQFRKEQVYVGKFMPPEAKYVPELMNEFIEWLNSNQLLAEAHPVQIAALAHYKFVYIHPFYDGNGRTARLLMNLILMKFGYPPVIIHIEDRLDYYDYLEMANQGDVKPFIRFIAKCTQRTLNQFIRMCNDSYSISVDDENKMFRHDLLLNDDSHLLDKSVSMGFHDETSGSGEDNDEDV